MKKKHKKYYWQYTKDKTKRARKKAIFDSKLITFNRYNHPSTKFKNIVDYSKYQKQFLTKQQILDEKLKQIKNNNLEE